MSIKPSHHAEPEAYRYEDDEISLIDIWLTLAKHKKLILGITAFFLVAGTLIAIVKPPKYDYRASIEIGSRLVTDRSLPIEQPENVLTKLQQSYIPAVLRAHYQATEIDDVEIDASIPKKSEIIVLSTKGKEVRAEEYISLQNQVIDSLKKDHQRIMSTLKAELEIKRRGFENQLASLKDQAKVLEADKVRLKERRDLLKAEIADLERLVKSNETQYKRAVAKPGNEANAMTLLLLDSESRATRAKLSDLQEKLQIALARDEETLANAVAENQRKQSEATDRIAKALLEVSNFRETRAVLPPMQSLESVGLKKIFIPFLAVFFGLFLGVFSAFIKEFLAKVKEQQGITEVDGESASVDEDEPSKIRATA